MKIRKYRSVDAARRELGPFWTGVRHGFQDAQVLSAVCGWRGYLQHGGRIVVYVVFSDAGDPLLAAPFRNHGGGVISVLGTDERFDYVDMIVGETSPETVGLAFSFLLAMLREDGFTTIRWKFLDVCSLLADEMKRVGAFLERTAENVVVDLRTCKRSDYAKRRIRVGTNRIKADGVDCSLDVRRGRATTHNQRMSQRTCLRMYIKRMGMILPGGISALRRITLRYLHYMSQSGRWDNVLHFELRISGEIAAFMDGIVSDGGRRFEMPRLAINPKYGRYTPGYLLMDRVIRWFEENDQFIEVLDLGRGKERYKFDFGGTIVLADDYVLELGGSKCCRLESLVADV